MTPGRLGRLASKIAWAGLRSAVIPAAVTVVSIGIAVATVASIRTFSAEAQAALTERPREWLAADISVQSKDPFTPSDVAAAARIAEETTEAIETFSMASTKAVPQPAPVSIKAIDPVQYPFYGEIQMAPAGRLQKLDAGSVLISPDFASRMLAEPGDTLELSGISYTIAGIIRAEPDRFAGSPNSLMRLILTHAGYERSGIAQAGNSALYRLLLRIRDEPQLIESRARLEELFPHALVSDFRDPDPEAMEAIRKALFLLNLSPWFAVALAAAVSGCGIQGIMQRQLTLWATLKAVGATRTHLLAIHALVLAMVLLPGVLLGWTMAPLTYRTMVRSLGELFVYRPNADLLVRAMVESALAVALPVLLVAAIPAVRRLSLRPWQMVRWIEEPHGHARFRWLLIGGTANTYAIRNLVRNRGRGLPLMMSMSIGIALAVAAAMADRDVAPMITDAVAAPGAELFVFQAGKAQMEGIVNGLRGHGALLSPPVVEPVYWVRLHSVSGTKLSEWRRSKGITSPAMWFTTCTDTVPAGSLRMSRKHAQALRASVGGELIFAIAGSMLRAKIERTYDSNSGDNLFRSLTFSCADVAGLSPFYVASLFPKQRRLQEIKAFFARSFPTAMIIERDELTTAIHQSVSVAARMMSAAAGTLATVAAGLLWLMCYSTQTTRNREVAVFKALGARSSTLIRLIALEFGSIGLLAGISGAILGFLLISAAMSIFLGSYTALWSWPLLLISGIAATITAAMAGVLALSVSIRKKPLAMLRAQSSSLWP